MIDSKILVNQLANETSPYLLQHAENPVEWYAWGSKAHERAQNEDRPILLSIGYSACHWCHVMEQESFSDSKIARIMNSLFVNIKVDREERPDLDRIYQLAHQILTKRPGGWPLTVFLTPVEHAPLFIGTYFPPSSSRGMPGFCEILEKVSEHYHANRRYLDDHVRAIRHALSKTEATIGDSEDVSGSITVFDAAHGLEKQFDHINGGFGRAPKFPSPTQLALLLRLVSDNADDTVSEMVLKTLKNMAMGGIYDQIGGGFFRYSTDNQWCIPHFEKMLYDNAQLLPIYADAHTFFHIDEFRTIAIGIAEWIMSEMQAIDGGYFSSLDADSEGVEGAYYLWELQEIRGVLDTVEWEYALQIFGLGGEPNFQKKWHLNRAKVLSGDAVSYGSSEDSAERLFRNIQAKLKQERDIRRRPTRDDKILTSWNALTIAGMARAGRRLNEPRLIDSSTKAINFICSKLWNGSRLFVTTRLGKSQYNGYLDDYAFLAVGLLECLQAKWSTKFLTFACQLLDRLLNHFRDPSSNVLYFTSDDHEELLYRPRPFLDDSIPSGNAMAAKALLGFGYLTGNIDYIDAAHKILSQLLPACVNYPTGACAMLEAEDDRVRELEVILLRGELELINRWAAKLHTEFRPRRLIFTIDSNQPDLPALIEARPALAELTAYVCRGMRCEAPLVGETEFQDWLNRAK